MTTYVPAKKNTALIFYVSLDSYGTSGRLQTNPTLASGDVQVSIDGGAFANLGTLPAVTPAAGKAVKVSLSSSEMNGDNIVVLFSDQTDPPEWKDYRISVPTAVRQIDDLAYPATSGRSMVVDASGLVDANTVKVGPTGSGTAQTARDVGLSVLLSAGTGTGQLDFTSGVVKANLAQILGTALTETAGQIAAAFKKVFDVASATFTALSVNQTGDAYARLGAPAGASLAADVAAVKVDTAAIKTKTDSLTFTGAGIVDANVVNWKGSTAPANTGDAFARLGAPAGASVSADVAAVKAVLPAALVGGKIDAIVEGETGTAQAGAAGTITLRSGAVATDSFFNDAFVTILSGTGAGQTRMVSGYVGSTKVATVTPNWQTNPDNTSVYAVIPHGRVDVTAIGGTAQTAGDVFARLGAPAGASVSADIAAAKVDTAAIKVQTDKLAFTVTNQVDANVLDWKSATAPAMTGDAFARLGAPAGASVSADVAAVKVDTAATRTAVGTAGAGLTAIGDTRIAHLDADVSSRLATSGYTAPDNTDIVLIKAKTDNLPASPAATSDVPTANANADALLDRTAGVDTGLTPRQWFRIAGAALFGKASGLASTTVKYRDFGDTKDRITATVDTSGDRTAITTDAT